MKKSIKIVMYVIIVIIVLWGIIFLTDYIKCSNFQEPIFVVAGETADDGGSGTYYGLGYKVKMEKTISAKHGPELVKVEMYIFDKFITGAIAETKTEVQERIKISDLKISNSDKIDTKKLVKFNNIVYGKSNLVIDYGGNLNTSIGTIDFLIDEIYFPELNGETNNREILNATILEADDKTMILNINNVAVLFEAVIGKGINEITNENKEYDSFVGTVLEETTTYMIVEPNEDEDERKSSDKIRINYGTDHIDYLYGIGRK